MNSAISNRLKAISRAVEGQPCIPVSICKRTTGETMEYYGMTVLQPFLNGELSEIRSNNPDIVNLLKSMAADNTVTIEIL